MRRKVTILWPAIIYLRECLLLSLSITFATDFGTRSSLRSSALRIASESDVEVDGPWGSLFEEPSLVKSELQHDHFVAA